MRARLILLGVMTALLICISLPASTEAARESKSAQNDPGPVPRLANGKPSMVGLWGQVRRRDVTGPGLPGYVEELPFTPAGLEQWENYDPAEHGDYAGSCLPFGVSRTVFGSNPIQLIQDNDHLVYLVEQNSWFHIVYTDGRAFDPGLPPSWWGESIGKWEGETLVVEARNLNAYIRVETIGHPLSREARFIQTFESIDSETMEHTFTVDDPVTYTRPWMVRNTWRQHPPGFRIMEYSCMENNLGLFDGSITPWRPPDN